MPQSEQRSKSTTSWSTSTPLPSAQPFSWSTIGVHAGAGFGSFSCYLSLVLLCLLFYSRCLPWFQIWCVKKGNIAENGSKCYLNTCKRRLVKCYLNICKIVIPKHLQKRLIFLNNLQQFTTWYVPRIPWRKSATSFVFAFPMLRTCLGIFQTFNSQVWTWLRLIRFNGIE